MTSASRRSTTAPCAIDGQFGSIPYLPALLSYQAAVIVPKHVAEADPEHWADDIETFVSGGPYILTKWDHNQCDGVGDQPHVQRPAQAGHPQGHRTRIVAAAPPSSPAWLNKETDLIHVLRAAGVGRCPRRSQASTR